MTVAHTNVLSLLGKEVSFFVVLNDELKPHFPHGCHVIGEVSEVIVALNGNHQIMVCDEFYELSKIDLIS